MISRSRAVKVYKSAKLNELFVASISISFINFSFEKTTRRLRLRLHHSKVNWISIYLTVPHLSKFTQLSFLNAWCLQTVLYLWFYINSSFDIVFVGHCQRFSDSQNCAHKFVLGLVNCKSNLFTNLVWVNMDEANKIQEARFKHSMIQDINQYQKITVITVTSAFIIAYWHYLMNTCMQRIVKKNWTENLVIAKRNE